MSYSSRVSSRPLFSIIVPAYNAERYLSKCLDSIARQTFSDFELIAVDDGSIDSTCAILDRFAEQGKPASVVLIHQDNRGLLAARLAGLEKARGEYVVFLDADDALLSSTLAVLASEIERFHADIIAFGMAIDPDFRHSRFCQDLPFGDYTGYGYGVVRKAVLQGRFNNICGKAIALAAFDFDADYSSYFGLMHGEDLFQLLSIMERAESCVHINKALYFYRRHEGSSTMTYDPQQLDDISIVIRRLLVYGDKWAMPQDAAYGALWNICCTVKTLVKDSSASSIRDAELDRFAIAIRSLGLAPYVGNQRLDNRLLLRSILRKRHFAVVAVVRILEAIKKVVSK